MSSTSSGSTPEQDPHGSGRPRPKPSRNGDPGRSRRGPRPEPLADPEESVSVVGKHPAQWLALVLAVAFAVIGAVGFFVTGVEGFAAPEGEMLFGVFEVNPLHNIVHLVVGIAGLALWSRLDRARAFGWLLVIGYGAALVYGLFVADTDDPANFLALNQADNWLHGVSAVLGLIVALWPDNRKEGRVERR